MYCTTAAPYTLTQSEHCHTPSPACLQGIVMLQNRDICNASFKLRNQVHENFSISVSVTSYPKAEFGSGVCVGKGGRACLPRCALKRTRKWRREEAEEGEKKPSRQKKRAKMQSVDLRVALAPPPKRLPQRGGRACRALYSR